jgi:hypothetical protein
MTGQELSTYIRKAESATDQTASITHLLKMLSRGEVKASDIQAHYKTEMTPTLNAMIQSFGRGELFSCQKQNFTAWLNGKNWANDEELAYAFKANAEMCGLTERNSRAVYDVWCFVVRMIIRNPHERKRQAESLGENTYREYWFKRCQREGWIWGMGDR